MRGCGRNWRSAQRRHEGHLNFGLSCGLPGSRFEESVREVKRGDGRRASLTYRPKPRIPSLSLKSGELQW